MKRVIVIKNGGEEVDSFINKLEEINAIEIINTVSFPKLDSLDLKRADIVFSTVSVQQLEEKYNIKRGEVEIVGPESFKLLLSIIIENSDLLKEYNCTPKEQEIIINSTHDAMIAVNKKGKITLINSAAKELLGKEKVYLNQPVEEVVPNTRLNKVLKTGKKELNKLQSIGKKKIITNRVPVKDDSDRVIGAVAVFRDVTEVKKLAEELTDLKEMRSMLEAIINSTQDAISVADKDGKGIMINPAYTRLTGLTEEEVIGKPVTVDIAEGESMHLKVLETEEPVSGVPMKVGPKRKDVIVNVSPIIVEGELKGSVGVIHDISKLSKLSKELSAVKRKLRVLKAKYTFKDIIGDTPQMISAIKQAKKASVTPATILLRGESGTGKELFAHAIHNSSNRQDKKFVRVNCPAIADSLLESELFGYEEGAFTGAKKGGKKGLFEEADGGTIFLDEVGKLDFKLQSKLLRVLQEKEIIRVGASKPKKVDVRIIVATNANLEEQVEKGSFRKDLYYRLNVIPIFIPPLRQRKDDIYKLVKLMLQKYTQEYGKLVRDISPEALNELMKYDWPGNVRELENVIGRSIINMDYDNEIIDVKDLPLPSLKKKQKETNLIKNKGNEKFNPENKTLKELVEEVEREAILSALEKTGGNKKEAAKLLGISIRSLYYKLDKIN